MDCGLHPKTCNIDCIKCFQKNVFKSKNSDLIMTYLKWIGCEHFKSHSLPPKKTDYPIIGNYKCECHNNLKRTMD